MKKVGISSQRLIETSVIEQFQNGSVKIGDNIELEMKLSIKNFDKEHVVAEQIKIK